MKTVGKGKTASCEGKSEVELTLTTISCFVGFMTKEYVQPKYAPHNNKARPNLFQKST